MDRVILHIDMNNFYASVECLYNPSLREKPLAVCGDPELRHGIVLAKNESAKKYGVKTGDALWQAQQKCPNIVFVKPHHDRYLHFSTMAREIYSEYTDQVEAFGLDENWLDVTGSVNLFGSGKEIADALRQRVKDELGITASVGVSYNKIFAKLGSDMKKPDATTEIYSHNFKEIVWPLPVSDLLYVGHQTASKLHSFGIFTIGELAHTDAKYLYNILGKNGAMIWNFANGIDTSPVKNIDAKTLIKSVGNSTTAPRDLICDNDVRIIIYTLAESVATRLREYGLLCRTVQIQIRDSNLISFERQIKLDFPVCVSSVIADVAYALFKDNMSYPYSIRSIGVRACDLVENANCQMSLLPESIKTERLEELELTVDSIRKKFGYSSVQRGIMFSDKELSDLNAKDDHATYPVSHLR
ncbi:MAG: DNA polymerase IV [Oscillospiraceae bacterium]